MANRRYNVLNVISDQHQAACMGCEGHAQALTPKMDRLAADHGMARDNLARHQLRYRR